jgi:hypothetical protein
MGAPGRTWQQLHADLSHALHAAGFDISHAFAVQAYNALDSRPRLPTYGRTCTLAVLVGNSRHLWRQFAPHLQAQAQRQLADGRGGGPGVGLDLSHPLDGYTTEAIEACVRVVLAGLKAQVGPAANPPDTSAAPSHACERKRSLICRTACAADQLTP